MMATAIGKTTVSMLNGERWEELGTVDEWEKLPRDRRDWPETVEYVIEYQTSNGDKVFYPQHEKSSFDYVLKLAIRSRSARRVLGYSSTWFVAAEITPNRQVDRNLDELVEMVRTG